MTQDDFRAFVAAHPWTFAKTMPHIPHEWSVRKDARDPIEFDRAVYAIRHQGAPMRWRRTPVRMYYDCDGWRYWTMDERIEDVVLINRQKIAISECVPA